MTTLPNKDHAIATLRESGYVRLGDHSATSMLQLEDIYRRRQTAWEEAEASGFLAPAAAPVVPAQK